MDYTTRIVKSASGLTQSEALLALQSHRQFQPGTKIASIHNQAGHWVAKLMVPKTASGWGDFGEGLGQAVDIAGDVLSAPIDAAGGVAKGIGSLAQGDLGGAAKELAGGSAAAMGDIGQAATGIANAADLPAGVTDAAMPSQQTIQQATQQNGETAGDMNSQGGETGSSQSWNDFYKPTSATRQSAEAFEDLDNSPAELHDEKHEKSESPLEEMEEHKIDDHEEKHERSEDIKLKKLEKKIDLLLDALGISEKGESPDEMPEGPSADLPAAPAPKSPKKSEPLPPGSGAKLKPGEVPNKPGVTPVGAPSFASVRSFTASKVDPNRDMSIRMAKAQLENAYEGFRVARIKRAGDTIHARMVAFSDRYKDPDHTCSKCYNKGTCWANECVNEHPKSSK